MSRRWCSVDIRPGYACEASADYRVMLLGAFLPLPAVVAAVLFGGGRS